MIAVSEVVLDGTRSFDRIVVEPAAVELERLLALLKDRRSGTLYLMTPGDRFFRLGVTSHVWMAGLCGGPDEPLWLSNPPRNGRGGATFDCGGTPTRIEARFTCRESDAIPACRAFFQDPDAAPPGNWIGE